VADRREQLLKAFDEAEENEEDSSATDDINETASGGENTNSAATSDDNESVLATKTEHSEIADSSTEEDADRRDEKTVSKSGKKPAATLDSGKKADTSKGAKKDSKGKTLDQTELEAATADEAPGAWRPAIREHWAKLPPEVREEVKRRETEITQFIGRHGAAIQHKSQFDEIVQPFMPFIAAQQSTPMKAFHSLMTTAARLTTGAPMAKAQVISEIMRNYGIDAKTLDEVLTAQMNGRASPVSNGGGDQPPAWAQPLFSFMQETSQARKVREDRVQQEAATEIQEFEKRPFFNDLREDIALVMKRATDKGELMTLDQAFAKARKLNPEIDKILTQRERAAASNNGSDPLARARRAASTVRGSPTTGVSTTNTAAKTDGKPVDRRSALSAAFDSLLED
jgi:hypothetical protein